MNTYTAVHGYITNGDPTIRDGGFSAQVLWIGGTGRDYIEVGWRKVNGGTARQYWGYHDSAGTWHFGAWLSNDNGAPHDFKIEHKVSDNKWHMFIDGVDRGSVALGVSQGQMSAGGEVTGWRAGVHNAMGISGFKNLSYMQNHQGYWSWSGWNHERKDYAYYLMKVSDWEFQNGGYNP